MAEAEANSPISLLFLSPKWQYDTYGVASVVRSLVNDLWLTDPDGQKIQMTCAVLQEDGKINEADVARCYKTQCKTERSETSQRCQENPNYRRNQLHHIDILQTLSHGREL